MTDNHPLRTALEAAFTEAMETWGESDGRHALPQAVQLRLRISRGESAVRAHPENTKFQRGLVRLYNRYVDMVHDKDDQARCERWEAAYARFVAANEAYLAAVKRGETT